MCREIESDPSELVKILAFFRSSLSPGRTYGKSSPRLEVKAAEEAFDKLVGDNMVVMEEDMVAEEKENLKTVEENIATAVEARAHPN